MNYRKVLSDYVEIGDRYHLPKIPHCPNIHKKIVERGKIDTINTHIYLATYLAGMVLALQ
jgi:hypothetical protein